MNPVGKRIRQGLLVGLAAVLLLAGGCYGECGCLEGGQAGPTTVVLVSIDTWRRDATGFLGGMQPSPTPFLDHLAKRSLVVTDAVTPVPLTAPSHWSMLTCRWPWRDGVRANGDLPADTPSRPLPEILREKGWHTAAFVSASVLDRRFGFARGFDHYDDDIGKGTGLGAQDIPERSGDVTVTRALDWIAREAPRSQKLFVWVHLFDPHFPYQSHGQTNRGPHGNYYAEVRFADEQVKTLYAGLKNLGRTSQHSLWVIIGDHGEGLGAHGEQTHGLLLHGATTKIPMLFHGAGITEGTTDRIASTVDLMPTVLDALSLRAQGCDGSSVLAADRAETRLIPLETLYPERAFGLSPVIGARSSEWLWERSPADHLWNVKVDPEETTDRAHTELALVKRMRAGREAFGIPDRVANQTEDPELLAKLNALGYLAGSTAKGAGDVRRFAREGMDVYAKIIGAQRAGDLPKAESYAMAFLDEYPRAPDIWIEAGFVAVQRGDLEQAERRFRRAVDLAPRDAKARLNLGNVQFELGRHLDAEASYRSVLEIDERDYFALYNLGLLLERQDRVAEARKIWRSFLTYYPQDKMAGAVRSKLAASGGG